MIAALLDLLLQSIGTLLGGALLYGVAAFYVSRQRRRDDVWRAARAAEFEMHPDSIYGLDSDDFSRIMP